MKEEEEMNRMLEKKLLISALYVRPNSAAVSNTSI
jgi:hypothetical protein